jgi:hypothetical protein
MAMSLDGVTADLECSHVAAASAFVNLQFEMAGPHRDT